jgi:ADP-dependent NAD(P)H-hydrate dehydratase / NAD(P)H-hydrate epimerase
VLPVLTSDESRGFDAYLIKDVGIPSLVLMENAARGVLDSIEDLLEDLEDRSVAIFCGKGNNGGDGLALARLLDEEGVDVHVFLLGKPSELSKDTAHELKILQKFIDKEKIHQYPLKDSHFLHHIRIGLFVDAILGTGSKGELKGKFKEAVLDIHALSHHYGAKVIAVDIPTGLDSDSGEIAAEESGEAVVVHADRTVTMGALKRGFFQGQGPDVVGEVSLARLGGPIAGWKKFANNKTWLMEEEDLVGLFPKRKVVTSKFDYGHVLSVTGSYGMTGAAILSAKAALRSGAGLVSVACPESQRAIVANGLPEAMTFGVHEDSKGLPTSDAFDQLEHLLTKANVVLYGSGILHAQETERLALRLLKETEHPLVLDAGGVIGLTKHHDVLKKRTAPTIITPHIGEFAQFLGMKREEAKSDRIELARSVAANLKITIVLKGAPTVIATPDGDIFINPTGNPGMATAGAGDVLGGMIAGVIAQSDDVLSACIFAVHSHGKAANIAAEKLSERALIASDIIETLPEVFVSFEKG